MSYPKVVFIAIILFLILLACGQKTERNAQALSDSQKDSIYTSMLIKHLQKNFDDIHDVSMRFHHKDHSLNGLIVIKMKWKDGSLQSAEVDSNETGDAEFGSELIKKMEMWNISGLDGPFETWLPLRIKIIGSDDPNFEERGIITGRVTNEKGIPIREAKVEFTPRQTDADSVRFALTNREGIFVRTLITPGIWDVRFSCGGYKSAMLSGIKLAKGSHYRAETVMEAE